MIAQFAGFNIKLGEADDIKIEWDKIQADNDSAAKKIAICKKGFEALEKLMAAIKNVDDEGEITICYPNYGAVFSTSIKSPSFGTFAHNAFRSVAILFYIDKWLARLADNDPKEFLTGFSKTEDEDGEDQESGYGGGY